MISSIHREILDVLIELYEKKKETVKGEDIAELLHRTPGTVRNQMQTLRALGYVDGIPGPKGGYTPALKAYESLGIDVIDKPSVVRIYRDGELVEGVHVQKMVFTQLPHPTDCRAMITVMGDTRKLKDHDFITVGPTPVNHVILKGEVVGRDDNRREILIAAQSITSIPKGKVAGVATRRLVSFTSGISIQECAKKLMEKRISAAPIIDNGELTGIITVSEIVRAVAGGRGSDKVGDIAVKEPLTIEEDSEIIECVEKMRKYDVGRLIVLSKGKPVGIITRTDILMRMLR
jgi:predicted transcriptional regulator